MTSWAGGVDAITLFQEDLDAARNFYERVFEMPPSFQDEDSAVFRFGDTLINLLRVEAGPELIEPAAVAPPGAGNRLAFTIGVEDVDERCRALQEKGIQLLNGPVNRPWGVRTASFQDPGGHIWEIAR